MSYFNYFPLLAYDVDGSKTYKLVTNIIKRIKVRSAIKDGTLIFDKYDVKYGENPEDVSYKYYDNSEYHWIVLMINNVTDRYYQWPLTDPQFQAFLTDKYGAGNEDGVHHYELAQTSGPTSSSDDSHMLEVNSDTENATTITNREYEEREQNKLRQIWLLDRRYISQFVEEFEKLIQE